MKRFMGSSWGLGTVTSEGHTRGRSPGARGRAHPCLLPAETGRETGLPGARSRIAGTDEAEVRAHERSSVGAAGGNTHPELPGLSRHREMKPTESVHYEIDIAIFKSFIFCIRVMEG